MRGMTDTTIALTSVELKSLHFLVSDGHSNTEPSLVPKIQAASVAAGIACPKHPRELKSDPKHNAGFRDHVTHAFWPAVDGCFRCAAEMAQKNVCYCGQVIHIPGGPGAPVPPHCAECMVRREPDPVGYDAAMANATKELEQIRMRREDRERADAARAAEKPKRARRKA